MSSLPFSLPDDPSHPVIYALSLACTENWNAFEIVSRLGAQADYPPEERISEAEAVRRMEIAVSHIKNVVEIMGWILYRKAALSAEEAAQRVSAFRELGEDWVEEMSSRLQRLPQGAPPKRRQSHVSAFEFMLQSKEHSLGKAVPKFCTCGGSHDAECRQNLKAGIHVLSKLLRKYAPELVAQYNALHPDRAKKSHG